MRFERRYFDVNADEQILAILKKYRWWQVVFAGLRLETETNASSFMPKLVHSRITSKRAINVFQVTETDFESGLNYVWHGYQSGFIFLFEFEELQDFETMADELFEESDHDIFSLMHQSRKHAYEDIDFSKGLARQLVAIAMTDSNETTCSLLEKSAGSVSR